MDFDRTQLDRILSMDDKSFAALTRAIAEAAGANKLKTEAMLSNPDVVKRRLAQMSKEEAMQLIDSAGKEKGEQILDMLRKRGVDLGQ